MKATTGPSGGSGLPPAVLLDMDGTLVDTEPIWSAAMALIAAEHGLRWDPAVDDPLVIGALVPDLAAVLRERGARLSVPELTDRLVSEVAAGIASGTPWLPGAVALLSRLAGAGIATALVTTSVARHADAVAQTAPPGSLQVVVAFEDVAEHKPAPHAYLEAARRLGVHPADCVVVEDSRPGVAAGLACGARTIAVQPRTELPESLAGHPRLTRVDGLAQAAALLFTEIRS